MDLVAIGSEDPASRSDGSADGGSAAIGDSAAAAIDAESSHRRREVLIDISISLIAPMQPPPGR